MKRLASALITLSLSVNVFGAPVDLEVVNTGGKSGTLLVSVFDNATDFSKQENGKPVMIKKVTVAPNTSSIQAALELPDGDYAIATFLDENNNGRLDTRFKIPVERFGFSNNPAIKFGAPTYGECEFKVDGKTGIKISLKKILPI